MSLESDSFVQPLFLKSATPKAHRLDVLLEHYTPDILNIAKELYKRDIEVLGYLQDVQLLEAIIYHRDLLVSTTLEEE